jgi:hypothetical protein
MLWACCHIETGIWTVKGDSPERLSGVPEPIYIRGAYRPRKIFTPNTSSFPYIQPLLHNEILRSRHFGPDRMVGCSCSSSGLHRHWPIPSCESPRPRQDMLGQLHQMLTTALKYTTDDALPGHTIYQPQDLGAVQGKMPVLVWGNVRSALSPSRSLTTQL